MTTDDCVILFVYGSLRPGGDAAWRLAAIARHMGEATLAGAALYRVADYPGIVMTGEPADIVHGDLFHLQVSIAALSALDDYEECSDAFPPPHEYIREKQPVIMGAQTITAWTYLYAWPIAGLERITSGDFLPDSTR